MPASGPGFDGVAFEVGLEGFGVLGAGAEVFAQAVVSRGESQDGFPEVLGLDLSGEAVGHAEVAEAAEKVAADSFDEVAAVDEVLLAEGEEVAAVGALGGGGEAEEEAGRK